MGRSSRLFAIALSLSWAMLGCSLTANISRKHGSSRSRAALSTASAGVLGAHLQYFGYYIDSPEETADHVNFTPDVYEPDAKAESLGLKYIIDDWSPVRQGAAWDAWVAKLRPHLGSILAFRFDDEPCCDPAADAGCLNRWAIFEPKIRAYHAAFPNTPVMINFIGNMSWIGASKLNLPTCHIPPGLDWISFDNYSRWDTPGNDARQVLAALKTMLNPNQKILLVTPGNIDVDNPATGYSSEDALLKATNDYVNLANSDPSVIGLIAWSWKSLGTSTTTGRPFDTVSSLPRLRARYREIGMSITGKTGNNPPPAGSAPPAAPTGSSNDCTQDSRYHGTNGQLGGTYANGEPWTDGRFLCCGAQFYNCTSDGSWNFSITTTAGQTVCGLTCNGNSWSASSAPAPVPAPAPAPVPPAAAPSAPQAPTNVADRLRAGQFLTPDQSIVSQNGRYRLIYQGDGNLVIYRDASVAVWSAMTNTSAPGFAIMQGDGNFVVYDNGTQAHWYSNTRGGDAYLVMQNDGNLVIYDSSGARLWSI